MVYMCLVGGGWGSQMAQGRLICAYLDYTSSPCLQILQLTTKHMGSIYGHVLLNLLEGVVMASSYLQHFLLLKKRVGGWGGKHQSRGYVDDNNKHVSVTRTCKQDED